ncbi:MAG: hypothetical protein QGI84_11515, partial [Dehalococcoidia bacterium]|nr:hypothetical protein [Dehalococcoidia bacterium]
GMVVSYHQDSLELKITMPFDPTTIGSTNHRWIDKDFMGEPVPQDKAALPGPIQTLQKGVNVFKIWRGLPLLAEGQSP